MARAGTRQARFRRRDPIMLVGRSGELATLREQLADVIAGRGSVALIAGDVGLGKTALARALCAEARARDVQVLVGQASDLEETPPYGIWLDLFAHHESREQLPPLPRVFAERGVIGAASSRAEIVDQAVAFVRALAADRPLLIVLDDLQWADAAALDLLRVLAREVHDIPLLLVVTYRSEDAPHRVDARSTGADTRARGAADSAQSGTAHVGGHPGADDDTLRLEG